MNRRVVFLPQVDSTITYLSSLQRDEGEEMIVVWTDFQTAGRGQGTNRWESAAGQNLLFSVMVRPKRISARDQFVLSMAGALALSDVLARILNKVWLKWPNDIYWQDRKLSGTLIEVRLSGNRVKDCLWGVGLNVNQTLFQSDAPNPVSLKQITGRSFDREQLLNEVLDAFEERLQQVEEGQMEQIRADYLAQLYRLGERANYRLPDGQTVEGTIETVQPDGRLQLRLHTEQGDETRLFGFKEIAFIGPLLSSPFREGTLNTKL